MAVVVLVHGIDQQQLSADSLEAEWLPALAGGVRMAGWQDIADSLWRAGPVAGGIECRMAFYGHLFLDPGQQGTDPGSLTGSQDAAVEALALEWLQRAAGRAAHAGDRLAARQELGDEASEPGAEAQGPMRRTARRLLASLARLRWFGVYGMGFAERFVVRSLVQVTRYLTEERVREAAQRAVLALIGPETRVVVGHSLGSAVAYEVAHRLEQPLPLLVTLGSPLGLDTVVYPKLRPQPPTFPPHVRRWVNVADRSDLVAAEPDLAPFFGTVPEEAVFDSRATVDNGAEPHRATFYLTKAEVGRPLAECLHPW
jgi:hypothetical protein